MTSQASTASIFITLYSGIFLLSANGIFAKVIPLDATTITQVRSVIGVIAISFFLFTLKRSLLIHSFKKWLGVLALGLFMGLHWVTYFHAMQISTVAIGMLSLYTFPVMIVMMEAWVHRRAPQWQDCLSAIAVLAGIFLMTEKHHTIATADIIAGVLWGSLSALFFSLRNILQKYYFVDVSSDRLMLHQLLAIAFMLLVFIDVNGLEKLTIANWIDLLTLGIVTTALGHILLVKSYKSLPAKTVAMISCLQPLLGALLAWLLLDETLSRGIIIGGAIILAIACYESLKSES